MRKSLFVFFMLCAAVSFGQRKKFKFGEGIKEHVRQTSYEIDTASDAVILVDVGKLYFSFNTSRSNFEYSFKVHRRIKVLKPSAFNVGDFSLTEVKKANSYRYIRGVKACSYNWVDGKMEKTKLSKKEILKEKVTEGVKRLKFSMPKVKEGTVIDMTYEVLSSDILNIPDWMFQGGYPILYSELEVSIPEFFKFMNISQGYQRLHQIKDYGNVHIGSESYNTQKTVWYAENVPALKGESYITTLNDYYSQIRFQLASTNFQGVHRDVMGTWDKIAHDYLRSEGFGRQIKKKGFYKDDLEAIMAKHEKPLDRAKEIYEFVRNRMTWNGKHRRTAFDPLRKKFQEQKGTSAEINLMLLSMLKTAGLQAEPVILSTRSNGKVHPFYPLLDNYNHVVAQVIIEGKEYLLDATDDFVPFGVLPWKCLNYSGRKIVGDKALAYSITPKQKLSDYYMGQFKLDEEGGIAGTLMIQHGGYRGISERKEIEEKTQEKYLEDYEEGAVDFEIVEQELKHVDELNKPLRHVVKLKKEGEDEDRIYLVPSLFSDSSNPFEQETRLYPVDFGAPISDNMNFSFELPEGFEVETIPKAVRLVLPDKGGSFRYQAQQIGNKVQVITRILITKPMYMPEEYEILRQLFSNINSKLDEAIVIKRTAI
ncbi:MAG: DUF3858 domain-containing protein [Cytophagales bacterium]|nr:DUF3858 domain-containing protein [Cytophagales bacterium]